MGYSHPGETCSDVEVGAGGEAGWRGWGSAGVGSGPGLSVYQEEEEEEAEEEEEGPPAAVN